MEKDFKRDISVLDAVFEFVDDFLSAQNAGERISYSIRLVVEELFINFIKHNVKRPAISQKVTEKKDTNQRERKAGADGKNNIFISLQRDAGVLRVRLTDYGVNPVSIPGKERTNITLPLQERQVGGLGIHLVRSLVDTLTYEYKDGNLSVTATKSMENKDV